MFKIKIKKLFYLKKSLEGFKNRFKQAEEKNQQI